MNNICFYPFMKKESKLNTDILVLNCRNMDFDVSSEGHLCASRETEGVGCDEGPLRI